MGEDDDNVLASSIHFQTQKKDFSNDGNTSSIQEEKDEEDKVETEKHVVNNVTKEEEGKYDEGKGSTYLTVYGDYRVLSSLAALPNMATRIYSLESK